MSEYETTIVPLDNAHEMLSAFGIGPDNREYQRWRRDDGFRLVDFEEVLATSPLVFTVDWREWLQDAADTISSQLDSFDIAAVIDLGEDGEHGTIEIGSGQEQIKYVPNDGDNFDQVIAAVNRLIAGRAHYSKFRSCEGSDSWQYALLGDDTWRDLQMAVPETIALLFFPQVNGT